jgi:hypothetical protein
VDWDPISAIAGIVGTFVAIIDALATIVTIPSAYRQLSTWRKPAKEECERFG